MASRRDELNAYTFAKRRMLAAFLQPSPSGSEEGAPRPLRAVVPSLVVGVLVLGGFGAWGMFKPTAPPGWDEPGTRVVVGKQSTTRYVVLETDGVTRLHPVLNLASARLLMKDAGYRVVQVSDKVLDSGELPRGPILGIPYAPDRLLLRRRGLARPSAGPSAHSPAARTARERSRRPRSCSPTRTGRGPTALTWLSGGDALYVRTRAGERHLVDARGTAYAVTGEKSDPLTIALVGSREPQPVTEEWLATLHEGDPSASRSSPPASATRRASRESCRRTRTGSAWSSGRRPAREPSTTWSSPARCSRSPSSPPGC